MGAELITAISTLAAVLVSVVALLVSLRADARAKTAARTDVYLSLRSRFLEVHAALPASYTDPNWMPTTPDEQSAVTRYWHHAYDEWYITKRLNAELLQDLWAEYYSKAILAGLRHNCLRLWLVAMTRADVELAAFWTDYRKELELQWAKLHPSDGTTCKGLECSHAISNPSSVYRTNSRN